MTSKFTQELLEEIRRDHYRLHAWRKFMSRSWARSIDDIHESPARTRSFWWWTGAAGVSGCSLILFAWWLHAPGMAISALLLWVPWYAGAVFFVLTHLGMVDNDQGMPHHKLLLPNGLSFLRLALAPLVLLPSLGMPVQPVNAMVYTIFIATLLVSDALDGWLARRGKICTRLGSMLDILADLALVTFLAVGLYQAGAIPGSLLWLLLVRFPLLFFAVLVLYFARSPATVAPTIIGKVTTFASSAVLLIVAARLLLGAAWPALQWIDWSLWGLHLLLAANILYLAYRGIVMIYYPTDSGASK